MTESGTMSKQAEWQRAVENLEQSIQDIRSGARLRPVGEDPDQSDEELIADYERQIAVLSRLIAESKR